MKFMLFMFISLATFHAPAYAYKESGGGDAACENRFKIVRDHIMDWLKKGGAQGLRLPEGVTPETYAKEMIRKIEISSIRCVSEGEAGFPVAINQSPKVCAYDASEDRLRITCDQRKFLALAPSDQYIQVNHEFAAPAGFEPPRGEDSDYRISNQLSEYEEEVSVTKLAVKPNTPAELEGHYVLSKILSPVAFCPKEMTIEYDPFLKILYQFREGFTAATQFIEINQPPRDESVCYLGNCQPMGLYLENTYADRKLTSIKYLAYKKHQPLSTMVLQKNGGMMTISQQILADNPVTAQCLYQQDREHHYPGRTKSCLATGGQGGSIHSATMEGHRVDIRFECELNTMGLFEQKLVFFIDGRRLPEFGVGTKTWPTNGSEPLLYTKGAHHFESVEIDPHYGRFISWWSVGIADSRPNGSVNDRAQSFIRLQSLLSLKP